MPSFMADLAELFPDTITCHPGVLDLRGTWTPSGVPVTLPCYYEGGPRLVRDASGQEVVSSVRAIVKGVPPVRPDTWRFTLPSRYYPHLVVKAITADQHVDELEPIALEIFFP